nr:MAG TPA: hypothetical protein [Caudoviricetes sp.]
MIQFTIDSFSGGVSGRPYNSINEAIKDGGYSDNYDTIYYR